MRFILAVTTSAFISINTWGLNDFGALAVAKKEHPAIFIPGNVLEYSVAGECGYIYNGESEKCFSGDMAESDSELYREAELDAKRNLLSYLSKGNPQTAITIAGARKIYEYPEKNMRRVICFVKREAVSITKSKPNSSLVTTVSNAGTSLMGREKTNETQKVDGTCIGSR